MATRAQKAALVDALSDQLAAAPLSIVSGFANLSVADQQALRSQIREQGATLRVIKNSLAALAADQAGIQGLDALLAGQSAFTFSGEDVTAAARVLRDFSQQHPTVEIRGGALNGEVLDGDRVLRLGGDPWARAAERRGRVGDRLTDFQPGAYVGWIDLRTGIRAAGARGPIASCRRRRVMAKVTKDDILESLDSMTVLELSELVEALKEKYNVSGAPMAVAAVAADNGAAPAEVEQTEFSVEITSAGQRKIQVIKAVREITGLGLREAKAVVDAAPGSIKDGLSREEADAMVAKLEEVGATVEVK